MWPFRNRPEPPSDTPNKSPIHYATTELQVGDDCICVDDRPHSNTHQKLLTLSEQYTVINVELGRGEGNYGGPFIGLKGIVPIGGSHWNCERFRKALKPTPTAIMKQVMEPTDLDVEKEKEGAY